ncbi:phosphoglycerate mutase (2,3-diphosphoglycerate-independent), partial [Candidatus Saccharibacteria bacterium]|nr:phosphoglycerate mutase (2,3-diphosphoglycerate-independent) [Candidatus Saccharibacteria bacterium]
MNNIKYSGPLVLAILDGVGIRNDPTANAVRQAHTEFLSTAVTNHPTYALQASGEYVGLLPGVMGNSEVGHNTLGSGQIIKQGIARIEDAFNSGKIWNAPAWRQALDNIRPGNGTLHLAGILSDGNVHSNINHLLRLIDKAHSEGVPRIRIHAILDGRDVPPQSAEIYIKQLEDFIAKYQDHPDYKIASGGGRMVIVADRYENDWGMVQRGWNTIVHGEAPNRFKSASDAITFFRQQDPNIQDQYIPPFVIVNDNNEPIGTVNNGDSFIYFDFRADRAIEIAMAFTYNDFPYFNRGFRPQVYFAGMTEYNADTHVPANILVPPVHIENTLNQYLGQRAITQFAISETVKFGHITYYFNGNSYERAIGEDHLQIPSDTLPFNSRPWMKSAEITDAVLERLNQYDFIRLNFPGGDMVGHFGELEPTITALEAIDIQLSRIAKV